MPTQTGSIDFKSTKGFQSYASGQYTTKTEFDNLEIGGRNLIRGTAFKDESDAELWSKNQNAIISVEDGSLKILNGQTTSSPGAYIEISVEAGEYTLRYKAKPVKTSGVNLIDASLRNGTTAVAYFPIVNKVITGSDWVEEVCSVTVSEQQAGSINRFYFFLSANGYSADDGVYIKELKLEKGNRATDWSPAPEDLDAHFEAVESSITQTADSITESVSKTYSTKDEAQIDRSGSGTSVEIDGAANAALKSLHIIGESVQDGTPTPSAPVEIRSVGAVNLLDETNVLRAYFATTGNIIASSGNYVFWLPCEPSTTYAVSKTMREDGSDRFSICYTTTTPAAGVPVNAVNQIQGGQITTYAGQRVTRAYTTGSDAEYIVIWGGIVSTFDSEYAKLQVSVGSYEVQYVPHENLGLLTRGKNLLWRTMTGGTVNGVTFTVNADGSVSTSGTATGNATLEITNIWLQAGTYTLSGSPSGGSYSSYLMDMNGSPAGADIGNGFTFTLAEDTVLPCLRIRIAAGTVTDGLTFRPQIEKGSESTEYEPYSGTVTPIPLNGHELRSLPDGTHDELTIDADGHVTMTQRVGAYHMADYASYTWSKSSSATNGYYIYYYQLPESDRFAPYASGDGNVYSNMASPASTASEYFAGPNKLWHDGAINFNLDGSVVGTTVAAFKTWLASSDLMAYAPLLTPQTIDLGTIDMPQVHDGDTVEVIAALTPSIDVTWWASAGQAVADAYASLSSAIEVRAESIVSTVSERYATSQEVQAISSQIEQTAQGWGIQFKNLLGTPSDGQSTEGMTLAKAFEQLGVTEGNLEQIRSYVRIAEETVDNQTYPVMLMGSSNSPIMLALSNKALEFRHGDEKVAYIDVNGDTDEGMLHITRAVVVKELQFGSWKWFERDGVGNLALKWVGDE